MEGITNAKLMAEISELKNKNRNLENQVIYLRKQNAKLLAGLDFVKLTYGSINSSQFRIDSQDLDQEFENFTQNLPIIDFQNLENETEELISLGDTTMDNIDVMTHELLSWLQPQNTPPSPPPKNNIQQAQLQPQTSQSSPVNKNLSNTIVKKPSISLDSSVPLISGGTLIPNKFLHSRRFAQGLPDLSQATLPPGISQQQLDDELEEADRLLDIYIGRRQTQRAQPQAQPPPPQQAQPPPPPPINNVQQAQPPPPPPPPPRNDI